MHVDMAHLWSAGTRFQTKLDICNKENACDSLIGFFLIQFDAASVYDKFTAA